MCVTTRSGAVLEQQRMQTNGQVLPPFILQEIVLNYFIKLHRIMHELLAVAADLITFSYGSFPFLSFIPLCCIPWNEIPK